MGESERERERRDGGEKRGTIVQTTQVSFDLKEKIVEEIKFKNVQYSVRRTCLVGGTKRIFTEGRKDHDKYRIQSDIGKAPGKEGERARGRESKLDSHTVLEGCWRILILDAGKAGPGTLRAREIRLPFALLVITLMRAKFETSWKTRAPQVTQIVHHNY